MRIYNPHSKPTKELPVIFGFPAGRYKNSGNFEGILLAEDGTVLGKHLSSDEAWLATDLGLTDNSSKHVDDMTKHYPEGFRCEYVKWDDVHTNAGLVTATANYLAKREQIESTQT
jgi:hypothetical protein